MAHASSLEKAKLLMKKARKARSKRMSDFQKLTPEEQQSKRENRVAPKALSEQVSILLYDLEQRQMPKTKIPVFLSIADERLKELGGSEFHPIYGKEVKRINAGIRLANEVLHAI